MSRSSLPAELYRAGVWVVVAVVAIIVWSQTGVDLPEPPDAEAAVLLAEATFDLNNDRAEGAPQQQVVNGWHAVDLLAAIVLQQGAAIESQQAAASSGVVANLLLVFGLGVCADLVGTSLIRARGTRKEPGGEGFNGHPSAEGLDGVESSAIPGRSGPFAPEPISQRGSVPPGSPDYVGDQGATIGPPRGNDEDSR